MLLRQRKIKICEQKLKNDEQFCKKYETFCKKYEQIFSQRVYHRSFSQKFDEYAMIACGYVMIDCEYIG